jgi:hypothetical protein
MQIVAKKVLSGDVVELKVRPVVATVTNPSFANCEKLAANGNLPAVHIPMNRHGTAMAKSRSSFRESLFALGGHH